MTLTMKNHPNEDNWETLAMEELFKLLKKIFPKKADMSGQTIYEFLGEKAKSFDFDLFDHSKLVEQVCTVLTKVETMTIPPGDVKQSIKQLTRDIIRGVGGTEGTKRFLTNEVEKEKPSDFEAYFAFVLKTHYETKEVALEAIRRGIISNPDNRISGSPGNVRPSSDQPNEDTTSKRTRLEVITPTYNFCNGCGRIGHKWKECIFVKFNHPDYNSNSAVA